MKRAVPDVPTRFCPICELRLDGPVCPTDGVPTVRADFDRVDAADDALGRVIAGRYKVERLLGQGASGRVYLASELATGRALALKLLQPHHARDRTQVRRFYREARAATRLVGEHVVRVLGFGVDDDTRTPYIALELLEGETLKDRMARDGVLAPRVAAAIGAQIARALVEAAERGIVHRDLKPANILLEARLEGEPRVKVTDFGVAKDLMRGDTDTLTAEGAAVGTPAYMAPEQVSGAEVGPRADLYALGCVLYETLTGSPPFESGARAELYVDHLLTPAPPLPETLPSGEATPPDLARLVARLLEKNAVDRPASAGEVAKSLEAIAVGAPATRSYRRRWALVVSALALGGAAAVVALDQREDALPAGRLDAGVAAGLMAEADASDVVDQVVVRGGAATIRLNQGAARPMLVSGDASLVTPVVDGRRLTLTIGVSGTGAGALVIDLWSPAWRSVKVTGAATIISAGALEVEDVSLNIAGSARAVLEVQGPALTSSIRGSSELVLKGRIERHEVRTAGAARLDAAELQTEETSLTAAGSSDAVVRVKTRLEARNDGTGEIRYHGDPAEVSTDGPGILAAEPPPW